MGPNVLLVYGGGSIKKNGIYDQVTAILKANGKEIFEDGGVMPNPTVEKLYEGSVCGCVLTMAGTGSEMNGGSVITNHESKLKIGHVFGDNVFPKFSILNPRYTFTLPKYQRVAGFFDIMSHILEQYFSGEDDNTSDYIMEGLLRSLIQSARIAVKNPTDYEARSNIMWTATWALNTLVAKGKTDAEIAEEGLECMELYMKELGLVMNSLDLGVTEDMLEGIADGTFIMAGGYKVLSRDEVIAVLRESMK